MKILLLHTREAEDVADPVLADLEGALGRSGHDIARLGLDGRIAELVRRVQDDPPDLVFNLAESFRGKSALESSVASLLNLLDLRYTGSSHTGLTLAGDKALAKKVLSFHGILTPEFAAVHRGTVDWAGEIGFPLIVKPPQEDASLGITAASVVHSVQELLARMHEIQDTYSQPVLVEQYIEGREFYVGVLGNAQAEALPIVELDMSRYPAKLPRIASHAAKWQVDGVEYDSAIEIFEPDLPEATAAAMRGTAVDAFNALRLRDYGRIDLRLHPDGRVFIIEANPNCYLARAEVFARAAERAGLDYDALIARIVELASARYAR